MIHDNTIFDIINNSSIYTFMIFIFFCYGYDYKKLNIPLFE
jgi:hypothetical protein